MGSDRDNSNLSIFFQMHGPFSFEKKIFLKNYCLYLGLVYQSCVLATADLDAYVRGFGLHGFKGERKSNSGIWKSFPNINFQRNNIA